MRKILLIIPAVLVFVLAATGIWVYKNKSQPTIKTKEIVVSPAELAEAEKIERFLLPPEMASVSGQIIKPVLPTGYKGPVPTIENPEKFVTEKARERVIRRKILEREIPNFKTNPSVPAFAPDGRIFPPELAKTYNYDNLLMEAVKQKVEGVVTIKTVAVNFSPKLQNQAEKIANELFNGRPATSSAGITINNFSFILTENAAQNFHPDEKPALFSSPMGQGYIFRKIVSQEKGLGITFEQWLKKFL